MIDDIEVIIPVKRGPGRPKGSGKGIKNYNTNRHDGESFRESLKTALQKRTIQEKYDALERVANTLISKAFDGDMEAIKEIANRIDGKAPQHTTTTHNHLAVFLKGSKELEAAMLKVNEHRYLPPIEETEEPIVSIVSNQ